MAAAFGSWPSKPSCLPPISRSPGWRPANARHSRRAARHLLPQEGHKKGGRVGVRGWLLASNFLVAAHPVQFVDDCRLRPVCHTCYANLSTVGDLFWNATGDVRRSVNRSAPPSMESCEKSL